MGAALGAEVLPAREGGSGPEALLSTELAAPLAFLGVMLPSDRCHAPDERAVLPLLLAGAEATAHLWRMLGERGVD
jgi:acetylornithine deacetylase/succinyl-diaminopimelate desuccinylase-like protein